MDADNMFQEVVVERRAAFGSKLRQRGEYSKRVMIGG